MNIGDYVAVGIGVRFIRLIRQIGRQTFSGGEAGSFTDEQQRDSRIQQFADVVEDPYAAMMNHEGLTDFPMPLAGPGDDQGKQQRNLRRNRRDGQAIPNRNLEIVSRGAAGLQFRARMICEMAA